VDYELRRKLLGELKGTSAKQAMDRMDDGLPKLLVVHECLKLRRKQPEWFGSGAAYTALHAKGLKAEHAVAFLRGDSVMTVAPRLPLSLNGDWDGTTVEVPAGTWRNVFTGERIVNGAADLGTLLREFPVALLVRE
jgi:(1->4)-alpha-D-glucan 1-alpha-D-glucosylmutase